MHTPLRMTSAIALVLSVAAMGCSGGSGTSAGPTAPTGSLVLASADLLVAGEPMNGRTVTMGHGAGEPALFMATLTRNGAPARGDEVWVQVDRPMGMMGGADRFRLYDDGTHGDPVAHDGLYHFKDMDSRYACNGAGMMAGEYHYEFHGETMAGETSNRLHVRVMIETN